MQLSIPTMDDQNKPLSITEEGTNAVGSEEEVEDKIRIQLYDRVTKLPTKSFLFPFSTR